MANLKLRDIKKSYGKTEVIHGLDLEVLDGEFCVLVGPSGCGKSTLLRMIAGLEAITEGSILINDERVNDVSAAKRGLAMVFQSYALYPHMTVRQNLAFGLENLKLDKDDIEQRINKAANQLRMKITLKEDQGNFLEVKDNALQLEGLLSENHRFIFSMSHYLTLMLSFVLPHALNSKRFMQDSAIQ